MKKKKKPQFDAEGYQINLEDLNGEALPDLSRAKVVSRREAKLPSVAVMKKALKEMSGHNPRTLEAARDGMGLTQKGFAEVIGVNLATYRQWESGRREPTGPAKTLLSLLREEPALIRKLAARTQARGPR